MRSRSRSNRARPYMARLVVLSRFTWPSTWPLLQIQPDGCLYGPAVEPPAPGDPLQLRDPAGLGQVQPGVEPVDVASPQHPRELLDERLGDGHLGADPVPAGQVGLFVRGQVVGGPEQQPAHPAGGRAGFDRGRRRPALADAAPVAVALAARSRDAATLP